MTKNGLLSGYRALDLTDGKGHVCGKILSVMGIETIKIEPPGGDPERVEPYNNNGEWTHRESSFWVVNNANKIGVTLDYHKEQGKALLLRLVEKADFLLESFQPGHLDSLGLGYRDLRKINPRLIMTSITLFGQKGPYSSYKGHELIASAMGGALINNGYEDRPPVKEALDANLFHANTVAVLGTIMAHYHRLSSGKGQHVDVAAQEVSVSRNMTGKILYQFDKKILRRSGDRHHMGMQTARWIWPCKDGYVWFNLMGGKVGAPANQALSQWMDDDGLENPLREIDDWKNYDRSTVDPETRSRFEAAIEKFFLNHTKKQISEEGLKRGIRAVVANTPADLLQHPQLKAIDYWMDCKTRENGGTLKVPKAFFHASASENFLCRPAPDVGEHNEDVYVGQLGLTEGALEQLKRDHII